MPHTFRPHRRPLPTGLAVVSLVGLTACSTTPPTPALTGLADPGIVIAQTQLVPGVTVASSPFANPADCSGPGLGIRSQNVRGNALTVFDVNGEPCGTAQVLFNGATVAGQRQADPGIQLYFHDTTALVPGQAQAQTRLGSAWFQPPALPAVPGISVTSQLLATLAPAAGPTIAAPTPYQQAKQADALVTQLATWQAQDATTQSRSAEADAAAARAITKLARQQQRQQQADATATLLSQLRERERQLQEEQRRQTELVARAEKNRALTASAQQAWQNEQARLQQELQQAQQRSQQFAALSARLAAEKAATEATYQSKITSLKSDLQAAQNQADDTRRKLVIAAAAKVAEAEMLARTARLQEQDTQLRESARLKAEANEILDRALALKAGENVISSVPDLQIPPEKLLQARVVLNAKDQTLPAILSSILQQAAAQAGSWQPEWRLSGPAQYLLSSTWSLTAEASVQQVLAQLQQQVAAMHGVQLEFKQFPTSRLLVITDPLTPNTLAPAAGPTK